MADIKTIEASALHVDTVILSHAYYANELPLPADLTKQRFRLMHTPTDYGDVITAYSLPPLKKSYEPRLSLNWGSKFSGIKTELSIAKLIDGTGLGIQTDEDIECAFDAIDDFIRGRIGMEFDSRTAKVCRLDVNADFQVGEDYIIPYLSVMSRPNSRMEIGTFGTTTGLFFNGSHALEVYGKKKEMEKQLQKKKATAEDVLAAEGLMRVEARLKTTQKIERLTKKLGLAHQAKDLINIHVASQLMSDALSQLSFDKPKFSLHERDRLLKKYFKAKAPLMLGTLEWRARYGEDFWEELKWSPSKYYNWRKGLVKVNLWSVSPVKALAALAVRP